MFLIGEFSRVIERAVTMIDFGKVDQKIQFFLEVKEFTYWHAAFDNAQLIPIAQFGCTILLNHTCPNCGTIAYNMHGVCWTPRMGPPWWL